MPQEWMLKYRATKSKVHARLQETQFCLEAAYKLFLMYREEKGFIPRETMLNQYDAFYRQLRELVLEQNERVYQNNGNKVKRIDYLQVVRTLYRDKRFKLVTSVKDFEVKEHDGIIHKDLLFFRQDRLMAKIKTFEPSAEFDEVLESLKYQQALKPGKDSNSKKLGGTTRRFYAVKIGKLL